MTGAEILREVVRELGGLHEAMVFTGGLVLPLYLERPPTLRLRATDDADAVVACSSYPRWAALQAQLMQLGVMPVSEQEAPICRMRTPQGHLLDVMPTDPAVLGFGNRWFQEGFEKAIAAPIGNGIEIKIFPAPLYAAAKAEAYRDRGKQDPWVSHDLEDFLTLVDCRPSFPEEVARAERELLAYLAGFAAELLAMDEIEELVDAHLRARVDEVLATLEQLSRLGQTDHP